ncbi:MAG: membrane dipeptidase [Candidatus Woesearchaeota archaeon]
MSQLDTRVFDLHTHPALKLSLLPWANFNRRYPVPSGGMPLTMRVTLDRLIEGNVDTLFGTIYVLEPELRERNPLPTFVKEYLMSKLPFFRHYDDLFTASPFEQCIEQLDKQEAMVESANRHSEKKWMLKGIEVAKSYAEMQEIHRRGNIALIHSIEGAHVLEGSKGGIERLETLYERGVAHIILSHFYPDELGGSVNGFPDERGLRMINVINDFLDPDLGLTSFGREVVERMIELGMIVDVCHGTPALKRDVYEMAKTSRYHRPVINSHTGLQHFADYPLNASDEDIRAIANTGGVIGLIMMSYWLHKPQLKDGTEILLKSIDHLIKVGGIDCVSFGSDFDGLTTVPRDMKSHSDFPLFVEVLADRYGPRLTEQFLYSNADRVLREGWGKN